MCTLLRPSLTIISYTSQQPIDNCHWSATTIVFEL
jgi:hypothetical protein